MGRVHNPAKRRFAGIPHHVMNHPDYYNLSGSATKLLVEFARQYNGRNNGKLCAVFSQLKSRGWRSEATLRKALVELNNSNLIVLTKQGRFGEGGRTPNYYALTWAAIDDIPMFTLDVEPTISPLRRFLQQVA